MRTERRPTSVPPTREAPEHVVVRLHRSARHLIWPALCFVAICFGTGFLWQRLPVHWLDTALPIAAAALVVVLSVLPLLAWLNRVTIITTRRIVVTQGFLVRERAEFLITRASEAVLRRGPLQLLAGSGDLVLKAGGERGVVLRDLPRARLVHRALTQLIERAAT